jgi:hypothetical protein
MKSPVYKAWTKAIRTNDSVPGYSASWITAVRGWLKVYPDRLECGDIAIPATAVRAAVLYEARQWFIPVRILAVTLDDGTYQFGLNPWVKIASHLPFPFRRERVQLRYSTFSIGLRVALIGYVAYLLYRQFTAA